MLSEGYANGLSSTASLDVNGDLVAEIIHTQGTSFSSGGQSLDYSWLTNSSGVLFYWQNTVVEPNEYSWTKYTDFFGDGITDTTAVSNRALLADGREVTTVTTTDAQGKTVDKTVTTISANDLNSKLVIDNTGEGITDRIVETDFAIDGRRVVTNTEFSSTGSQSSQAVTTTSSDRLFIQVDYSNGTRELTEFLTTAMGSYRWTETTSGSIQVSSHSYDATGIDVWTLVTSTVTYSTTLDGVSELRLLSIAERLYDTLLDRDMYASEQETLVKYITDGSLDRTKLAGDILASTEFTSKYGTLSNSAFITQLYDNAVGRSPTLLEIQSHLTALVNGSLTRTALALTLSCSSEHVFLGTDHILTNNTYLNIGGLTVAHQTDHILDGAKAGFFVAYL